MTGPPRSFRAGQVRARNAAPFHVLVLSSLVLLLIAFTWSARFGSELSAVDVVKEMPAAVSALPIYFIQNSGQQNEDVRYHASGAGYSFFLNQHGATYVLDGKTRTVLDLELVGASSRTALTGQALQETKFNYFTGDDPGNWRTDLPSFSAVQYGGIYPGIDLTFSGSGQIVKYEYAVAPGADPSLIDMRYKGATDLRLDRSGNLVITTPGGTMMDRKPTVYQYFNGVRRSIEGGFVLTGGVVGFTLGEYDTTAPLIIDPGLEYGSFIGGAFEDNVRGIALDDDGNTYLAGETSSSGFPTPNGYDTSKSTGYNDAFIVKMNAAGDGLVYGTFLGGGNTDGAYALAVGTDGSAYIAGMTKSTDLPAPNGYRTTFVGGFNDAFVAKLGPSGGTLEYGTYLGGTYAETAYAIALDSAGNAFVTGGTTSLAFPVATGTVATPPGFDTSFNGGGNDVFVTKLGDTGGSVVYSTYLGGSFVDAGKGITVDASGDAFVAGETSSSTFPTASAYDSTFNSNYDAFVTKLNPTGTGLIFSTFLGGSDSDKAEEVEISDARVVYVTGKTSSTNFPSTNGYDRTHNGYDDAFVAKFSASGSSLLFGTYLGGNGYDSASGLTIDAVGSAYVTGATTSSNFPTHSAFDTTLDGYNDAFITKLSPSGSSLSYSTYLGGSSLDSGFGIAVNQTGMIYSAGETTSFDFPVLSGYDESWNSKTDVYVVRFQLPDGADPDTVISSGPSGTIGVSNASFEWTGNDDVTAVGDLVYSYMLSGYDSGWSTFGPATTADYTGLPDGSYTFTVKAKDLSGNEDQSPAESAFTVAIPGDADPDTAISSGPIGIISVNSATFVWTGSDDLTPVGDLDYAYMLSGYDSGWSAFGPATTVDYTGLANGSYTFMVKAKDLPGNEDPTPAGRAFTVAVSGGGTATFEETDPNILYSANCWSDYSNVLLSSGAAKISAKKPCTATFTFVGSQVDFISARSKQLGKAKIYVDGVYQQTLDLYSKTTVAQYEAFIAAALTLSTHTIKVEVLRTKNSSSSGYYVPVDAFRVTS